MEVSLERSRIRTHAYIIIAISLERTRIKIRASLSPTLSLVCVCLRIHVLFYLLLRSFCNKMSFSPGNNNKVVLSIPSSWWHNYNSYSIKHLLTDDYERMIYKLVASHPIGSALAYQWSHLCVYLSHSPEAVWIGRWCCVVVAGLVILLLSCLLLAVV